MSRFKLYATNIATAVLTCFATSLFWIAAYGNSDPPEPSRAPKPSQQGARPPLAVGPTGLAIPVAGVAGAQLVDTYSQARAGGARVHDAIDIVAPEGTPVVAAAPGTIEKLFFSKGGGGTTVYVRSPDRRWIYYYAHLRDYAPGLAEQQVVRRGTLLGHVGHSGNASGEGPHLHFAINRMAADEPWYQGRPINPYPLLAGSKAGR